KDCQGDGFRPRKGPYLVRACKYVWDLRNVLLRGVGRILVRLLQALLRLFRDARTAYVLFYLLLYTLQHTADLALSRNRNERASCLLFPNFLTVNKTFSQHLSPLMWDRIDADI